MLGKPFSQFFACFLMFCLLCLVASQAHAHRVNIFAWVESGQVHVKASFSRKNPARESTVIVLDGKSQAELLRGQTDESGIFVFAMPETGPTNGLLVRVNAGEGHQNDWQLKAGECAAGAEAAKVTGSGTDGQATTPASGSIAAPNLPGQTATNSASAASLAEIRAIVDAALENKLGPIREAIAQQSEQGPRLADIVGGLGWIMGIVGIGLAFKARKA